MKKTYRLVLILILLVAVGAGMLQGHIEKDRATNEAKTGLRSLSVGFSALVGHTILQGRTAKLAKTLRQFDDSVKNSTKAIVCSRGRTVAVDSSSAPEVTGIVLCNDRAILRAEATNQDQESVSEVGKESYLVYVRSIMNEEALTAPYSLVLVHSMAPVKAQVKAAFFRAFGTALFAGILAFMLLEFASVWLLRRSMVYLVRWVRSIFRAESEILETAIAAPRLREVNSRLPDEFRVLTKELSSLALKVRQSKLRESKPEHLNLIWNSDIANKVQDVLKGRQLVIVANREPYSHLRQPDGTIKVQRPASGVVTALEPIMRVCGGGIWVGHGSGNADREVVDANNEIKVPPEAPTYTLRRVWLTPEEEAGYYYGFSNEGLWPLCHLAYTRPTFRLNDWETYKSVNRKFAETTLRGIDPANTVILVQDYHYALLPQMLRERAPAASIELFWHIPWPNPEAFGICPQYKDLLEGMLGADVIGFHTQFHCNNFLETCDRYLECRVDWERFSVTINNRETLVRSYPISIATEPVPRLTPARRKELKSRYQIDAEYVALGVDRLDYTKGLVERVAGVERFLEKYPQFVGKFSFIEMGTPSRTNIPSYRLLVQEVEEAIERVNLRFGVEGGYRPIVMLKGHFDWKEVAEFYQLGQACLVTSLHDGMNLVAKEYVWSQDSEQGALILSRFTGAAREMSDAIIVNPYSSEEIADALYEAFTWTNEERAQRMTRMKARLETHNAFHWATDLLAGVNAKA